jgi:hypothetical protein
MGKIRLCHAAGKFLRQQRNQRDVSLLHHLRALRVLAADHQVDRQAALGVGDEVNRGSSA